MKPLYPVYPELLKMVGRVENLMCEGLTPVNQITYMPIGGESNVSKNWHQVGYYFFIEIDKSPNCRIATALYNTAKGMLEVTLGWSSAFNDASGMAIKPRDVQRPDSIFFPDSRLSNRCLKEVLTETNGVSLRFTLDPDNANGAAELVGHFLLNHELPPTIQFL